MNELRNGLNTRLESKNIYEDKTNYFQNRNFEEQTIIKPINQDTYVNFEKYNKSFNKSIENNFNDDITNVKKDIIDNNNLNTKLETNISSNIVNNKTINKLPIKKEKKKKIVRFNKNIHDKNIHYKNENIIKNGSDLSKKCLLSIKKNYLTQNKEKLTNILLTVLEKRNIFVKIEDIQKFINKYNLSYSNPDPILLKQIITDFKQISIKNKNTNKEYKQNNIQNDNNTEWIDNPVIYNEFLISIDSRDRNISKFNNPNEFKIDFTPDNLQTDSLNGYISTKFENVISVQLISAIFPKEIKDGNSLEDYPYIILEIDELGSSYKSTNNNSSKAFAQLTFDIDIGKFKKLVARTDSEYKKNFNHRISLDSFTLRIKIPNGDLYNFGPNKNNIINTEKNTEIQNLSYDPDNLNFYKNTNDLEKINIDTDLDSNLDSNLDNNHDYYFPINFVFKIIVEQKKLDNIFIKNLDNNI